MRFASIFAVSLACLSVPAVRGDDAIDRMKKDLFFLAGEECEGRGLKTKGIDKAAEHIAASFKAAGLKPAGADGTYFQPFTIKERFLDAGPHRLVLTGPAGQEIEAAYLKQFTVTGVSGKGEASGELVFAGYGITAAKKYDDYAGIDVKGKIVVIARQTPRAGSKSPLFEEKEIGEHAALVAKVQLASKLKAAAVILINDRQFAGKEDPLMRFDFAREDGLSIDIPVLHARRDMIDRMLAVRGVNLGAIEAEIDRTLQPSSFAIPGWSAKVKAVVGVRDINAKNVVGYLEGKGPLAKEAVVLGAHYDHLGRGETGTKLPGETAIHFGADDNASGTTGLLELARRFAGRKDREGRRMIFIAFSGEERGLFGSLHYASKPTYPIEDTVAMLNMDMIGRVRTDDKAKKDRLLVGGVGSAKNFEELLDGTNKKFDFLLEKSRSGTGPSDHTSFYVAKVPVYFFFSGDHPEYHTPKDRPETINVEGIRKVIDMVDEMSLAIAAAPKRPEYVAGVGGSSGGAGGGPKLGLMPRYDDAATTGMGVGAILPGGAAEAAGIKKDDLITAIDGKKVKNVQDYMKLMAGTKRGEEIELTVDRDGKILKLKATPK